MSDTTPYQNYLAARAEYLGASGWLPIAPINPGGSVLWKHPTNGNVIMGDNRAAIAQEDLDFASEWREKNEKANNQD